MLPIQVDPIVYIWLALGVLVFPASWLMAAVIAAVFHECCHFLVAKLLNVHISNISIGIGGMVMELEPMPAVKEFLIAIAGPLGSILLCLLLRFFPELAICGIFHGVFNLLPIYPLDGGRLLYCVLGRWASQVETLFLFLILTTATVCGIRYGMYPFLFGVLVAVKAIQRKFPCKVAKHAVQ